MSLYNGLWMNAKERSLVVIQHLLIFPEMFSKSISRATCAAWDSSFLWRPLYSVFLFHFVNICGQHKNENILDKHSNLLSQFRLITLSYIMWCGINSQALFGLLNQRFSYGTLASVTFFPDDTQAGWLIKLADVPVAILWMRENCTCARFLV